MNQLEVSTPKETPRVIWNNSRFFTELKKSLQTIRVPGVPIDQRTRVGIPFTAFPTEIDVGALSTQPQLLSVIEQLEKMATNDSEDVERAAFYLLDFFNNITLQPGIVTGSRTHVSANDIEFGILPTKVRELLALSIHTHAGYELPPSPTDFLHLVSLNNHGWLETALMVITPLRRYLLLRSQESPILSDVQIAELSLTWDLFIQSYMAGMVVYGGSSPDNLKQLNHVAQINILQMMCTQLQIGLYIAETPTCIFERKV